MFQEFNILSPSLVVPCVSAYSFAPGPLPLARRRHRLKRHRGPARPARIGGGLAPMDAFAAARQKSKLPLDHVLARIGGQLDALRIHEFLDRKRIAVADDVISQGPIHPRYGEGSAEVVVFAIYRNFFR